MTIRKRYIISFLIAAICIAAAKNFWYLKDLTAKSLPSFVFGHIDFLIIVTIGVVSFLIALKITAYLADFKNIEKQSRIDIIFLLIFFVLLFIPMSKINKAERSAAENRRLAVYKPLINKGKINYNFGKNYDSWFSDRFNLRKCIINVYSKMKYKIAYNYYEVPNKAFINKKTNWCIRIDNYTFNLFKPLKQKQIQLAAKNFNKLNQFCIKHNIKLYILVAPIKEDIYRKNLYPYIVQENDNFEALFYYVKNNYDINLIYPHSNFLEQAENNHLFFKTDHHWTDMGAYIAYKELVKEIKKDFPDFKNQKLENFNIKQSNYICSDFSRKYNIGETLIYHLNLKDKKILDTKYKYLEHKDKNNLKIVVDNKLMKKIYKYENSPNNMTAVLLGNSMCENLTDIIPYDFKKLKRIRTNNKRTIFKDEIKMSRFEKEILNFKPDILIICFDARYIEPVLNMYKKGKK